MFILLVMGLISVGRETITFGRAMFCVAFSHSDTPCCVNWISSLACWLLAICQLSNINTCRGKCTFHISHTCLFTIALKHYLGMCVHIRLRHIVWSIITTISVCAFRTLETYWLRQTLFQGSREVFVLIYSDLSEISKDTRWQHHW